MKTKLFLMLTISVAGILILPGCAKKQGCTDAAATNYDADAEEDDGSCQSTADLYVGNYFSNDTMFVTNPLTGQIYTTPSTNSFTITKVSASVVHIFNAFGPNCGDDANVTETTVVLTTNACGNGNYVITFNSTTGTLRYTYADGGGTYSGTAIKQ